MLPVVLVLLVASNALALPVINVESVNINEVAPRRGGGSAITDAAFEVEDSGENSVYGALLQAPIVDLSGLPDKSSRVLALTQTIATLGVRATGLPGDACAAAGVIDSRGAPAAVANFLQSLINDVRNIAKISRNTNALKYVSGIRGNCPAGGRQYQFEAAWNRILDNATPAQASILKEQYCAAKRLYDGTHVRSNNLAASITAASLPSVNNVLVPLYEDLQNFVASINTVNVEAAANRLAQRLSRALDY